MFYSDWRLPGKITYRVFTNGPLTIKFLMSKSQDVQRFTGNTFMTMAAICIALRKLLVDNPRLGSS